MTERTQAPGAPDDEQVALVTGATAGIGRAIALRLGTDGFTVIVHGRNPARGAATVAAIQSAGGQARFAAADLSDAAEVARLAEAAGPVDVLVNNAGFSWFGPTADLDPATFDRLFTSNVRSAGPVFSDGADPERTERLGATTLLGRGAI